MYLSHAQTAKARTIRSFQMANGFTVPQACAWLAMALGESSLIESPVGDHGQAFGLYQEHDSLCDAIKAATRIDMRHATLEQQLIGVLWEVSGRGPEHAVSAALKAQDTPSGAAGVLVYLFERPANKLAAATKRGAMAEEFAVM